MTSADSDVAASALAWMRADLGSLKSSASAGSGFSKCWTGLIDREAGLFIHRNLTRVRLERMGNAE